VIELLLQAERALSVGLLDRAETLYRQVATADPRNSIAVVGLARVAIERGDELEALELGRRALEIDPENSAAQRLVQRLEEVRAYRGEPTPAARPSTTSVEVTVHEPEPPTETPPTEAPTASAPPLRRSFLDRLFRRR
jgi:tetratricopeptide (TPR) repeat protein